MSDRGEMFNKKAASGKSRPDEVMRSLGLKAGQSVADIGSGGGYFAMRFAEEVGPKGCVHCVDVDEDLLSYIEGQARGRSLSNMRFVKTSGGPPKLPASSLDLVFMRNATHHMPDRPVFFMAMGKALKPGGRIVVIEYDSRKGSFFQRHFSFHARFGHEVKSEDLIAEAEKGGLRLAEEKDFLPTQSYLVFKRA